MSNWASRLVQDYDGAATVGLIVIALVALWVAYSAGTGVKVGVLAWLATP